METKRLNEESLCLMDEIISFVNEIYFVNKATVKTSNCSYGSQQSFIVRFEHEVEEEGFRSFNGKYWQTYNVKHTAVNLEVLHFLANKDGLGGIEYIRVLEKSNLSKNISDGIIHFLETKHLTPQLDYETEFDSYKSIYIGSYLICC